MSGREQSSIGTRVLDFLKDHFKISLFLIFNSILPLTDVVTDSFTSYDLYVSGHVLWATITFYLMWNPFIVHLLAFLFNASMSVWYNQKFDLRKELTRVLFFFPYLTPLKNIYFTVKLYKLKFGMKDFEARNAKEVERIQHQAGSEGMFESFLESGPQCVVQIKIILSTGSISYAQIVSIPVSVFSLAWASSRAYFIQRDQDNSDPDPELKMVATRILPWMLIVVVHSLTVWTCIAGLLGEYVIPSICLYFLVASCLLKITNEFENKRDLSLALLLIAFICLLLQFYFYFYSFCKSHSLNFVTFILVPTTLTLVLGFCTNCVHYYVNLCEEQIKSEDNSFLIKTVITSVWLPCVVGRGSFTFLLSSMISLILKNLLLLFAMAFFLFSESTQTNVFLFWCVSQNSTEIYEKRNISICDSLHNCFNNIGGTTTEHKVRVCQEKENYDFIFFSGMLVIVLSVLSIIASVKLENLTNNVHFYRSTKKFLCFQTNPVVHRSLVFTLASDNKHAELLEEVAEDTAMINRPRRGDTPLHYSIKEGAWECAIILLRKGTLMKENGEGRVPKVIESAIQGQHVLVLDEVARLKRETPAEETLERLKHLQDNDIWEILQQEDRGETLLTTSLRSPALMTSTLNLLWPMAIRQGNSIIPTIIGTAVRERSASMVRSIVDILWSLGINEGYPILPPIIQAAVQERSAPFLDQVARLIKETKDAGQLQDNDIWEILQQGDQGETLLSTSLRSPALMTSMLNLLIPMFNRDNGPSVPQIEFLQDTLKLVGLGRHALARLNDLNLQQQQQEKHTFDTLN